MILISEIRKLVINASGGVLNETELENDKELTIYGYSSINIMNLVNLLEKTYGICFQSEDELQFLKSVETIYEYIQTEFE